MQFNPLFIQTGTQPDSTDVFKQSKLTNSSYLFSDIIRIINENLTQSNSSQLQQSDGINNLLSNILNNGNIATNQSNKDLIASPNKFDVKNVIADSQSFPASATPSIDVSSLVKKLSLLFNELGISPDSLKLSNDNIVTSGNNNKDNALASLAGNLNNSQTGNPSNQIIIDLTNQANSLAANGKTINNQIENSSGSLEKIYSLLQNLFSNSNLIENNDVNVESWKDNSIKDKSAKNNSSKDNQPAAGSPLEAAVLNLLQNNNSIVIKLPNAELQIDITKTENNISNNNSKDAVNVLANLVNDQTSGNKILGTPSEFSVNILSDNSEKQNANTAAVTKFPAANNVADPSSSKANNINTNQLFDNSLKEINSVSKMALSDLSLNQNQDLNPSLQDSTPKLNYNIGPQAFSAKLNISVSAPELLKSFQSNKTELKTSADGIEKLTSFTKDFNVQDKANLKSQFQIDSPTVSPSTENKINQNLLKNVESIKIISNPAEDSKDVNAPDKSPDQLKQSKMALSADDKPLINNENKNINVQPADNSSKTQNDNNQASQKSSDEEGTVQIVPNKPESSTDNQQSKNNFENSRNNELKFIPNQFNDLKNSIDSMNANKLQTPEPLNQTIKTVKVSDVVNEISNMVKEGNTKSIVLNLKPESLGSMKVTVDVSNNTVHANVEVDTEAVKLIVQNNINDLKQSLNQNGMQLSTLTVNISGGEQKFNRSSGQKKKSNYHSVEQKVEINNSAFNTKSMGYNTYEFLI
ncbi:MAG: flagellar hook-length control protein FliK [Bacteroidetes bacterium]|nr:flagellar hook-length control protein FliK [Bacteroidota bacterium]